MRDLLAALCLVAVLEGLLLFAAPGLWRRTMAQLLQLPAANLRRVGVAVLGIGLLCLWWIRH